MKIKAEQREEKRKKARQAPKGGTLAATCLKRKASRDFARRPRTLFKKKRK